MVVHACYSSTEEDYKFQGSRYIGRPCFKQNKTKQNKTTQSSAGGSHYNLSYSGSRDQEDCHLKPAQANSSRDPISKKPITIKAW
jgi:hypothetical protein